MADEPKDNFATITDKFQGTSSQKELLSHAQFVREDETFPEDEQSPSSAVDGSGESARKLNGVELERSCGGEFAAGGADNGGGDLGFREERKKAREEESSGTKFEGKCGEERKKVREEESSGTKFEGKCGKEREIEPQLQNSRVSPLFHCSGIVIEEEDDEEKKAAFSGDLMVDVVSTSPCVFVHEGVGYTEQSDSEGFEDSEDDVGVEDEVWRESRVKRKLEFFTDTDDHGEDIGNEEQEDGGSWREEKAMEGTNLED